jgi:hypothetical protein
MDGFVYRRLTGWLYRRGGQRAQRSIKWTSPMFWNMGLHRLPGTVRYPSQASSPKIIVKPYAGKPHVRLCVQRRLACSVGDKPTEAKVRSLVAWIAGRKETEFLKPIDGIIHGVMASHWAVTKVNADVASKVSGPRGRACNRRAKAAWMVAPD